MVGKATSCNANFTGFSRVSAESRYPAFDARRASVGPAEPGGPHYNAKGVTVVALAVVAERGEHPRHLAGRPGAQLFDGLMAWQGGMWR